MLDRLNQFLVDITRGGLASRFASDPDTVIADARFPDEMQKAIREGDVGFLYRFGAHPMALLYFARATGMSNEQYYQNIPKE
ncbi:hypothetical protein [Sphingopyxis sp. 113P3]|uniref:hypothetical protein n=1 Tax=Sphingopyxis sp. (strain 113P3) TaxID=292913 RepID=UPI0006AD39CC|nr:hypothetical protein [Sphingopyxis sp. 113P3]ALC11091.1 hypothetical protein LH20_03910 [Sphingopyxis sp. 113P3]